MKLLHRMAGFFVLSAALVAPGVVSTRAAAQDDRRREEAREHQKQVRIYDRDHKDYHNWDDNETRYYNQYRTEQHWDNRDYARLKRNQQAQYWKWRHEHEEHENKERR